MSDSLEIYRTQSRWTDPGRWTSLLAEIPPDPETLPKALERLLMHPFVAPLRGIDIPGSALDDRDTRSVEAMLDRVHARDARPLSAERRPEQHFFCVCAGFARVATAVLRMHAIPARCRVGFAAYFNPGFLEDHWVCEYWTDTGWRLLDAQLGDEARRELSIGFAPSDVPREQFVDASTAWTRLRAGEIDPTRIGLSVLGLTGAWFAVGNLMLDAAALNKEEMLPWEKWSVARDCGPGQDPTPEVAAQLDDVARLLQGSPDAALAERVYRDRAWLRVTPTVLSFASGAPVEIAVH